MHGLYKNQLLQNRPTQDRSLEGWVRAISSLEGRPYYALEILSNAPKHRLRAHENLLYCIDYGYNLKRI